MKKTSDVMRARNLEIYQRRKSGESYQSIAAMFGLSRTWVIKICYRERKLEFQPTRQEEERPQRLENTDLYLLLVRDHPVIRSSGKESAIPLQAYHCLYRQWLKSRSGEEDYPTIDFLLSLQDEQIRNMHRVGPAIYDYLLLIKQELVNN